MSVELEKDKVAFASFGREVFDELIERVASESMDENDVRFMEIAAKHGLVRKVAYDPAIHDELPYEAGTEIWYWGK